ncbi:MAG TPA: sigma-70 family RNA polymerase sigma factor [Actinocrinis sp.]|nr:sigma-70 family RNA polymerase sigma factor [Actinocrinis sp.]
MQREHGAGGVGGGGTGGGGREPEPGAATPPEPDPPDRELIDRVRAGDLAAYDPLYQRHARSALAHARHWARSEAAAEDLRAEAFTRVLHAIRNGNGPTEAFRPYLLTTMRHVARDWAAGERRLLLVADIVDLEEPEPQDDPVLAALERSLAGQAFMALPERWQTVLWHTEVEGEGPAQLAPVLGIEPAAVAALAYRAREGLKQAYLQAHVREVGSESCRPYAQRLGAAVRGKLGRRERGKVEEHVRHCVECAGLLAMLKYVNAHLGAVVAPAVLGTAVATKTVLAIAAGAGAAAGTVSASAASGSSGASAAHAGALGRGVSKLRHASPRQQAVALGTAAAVAAGALAFALTGSHGSAPPPAAASHSAVAELPPSSPPPVVSPSPSATPSSSPSAPPPRPSPRPVRPSPSVSHRPTPSPSRPAPSPSPSPASPSPSPLEVMCPGIPLDVLGIELRLEVQVRVSLGRTGLLLIETGCNSGPPTPF